MVGLAKIHLHRNVAFNKAGKHTKRNIPSTPCIILSKEGPYVQLYDKV